MVAVEVAPALEKRASQVFVGGAVVEVGHKKSLADELGLRAPRNSNEEDAEVCSHTAAPGSLPSTYQEPAIGIVPEAEVVLVAVAVGLAELGELSLALIPQTTVSRICEVCNLKCSSQAWSYSPSKDSSPSRSGPISVILMVSSRIFRKYRHPPISAETE